MGPIRTGFKAAVAVKIAHHVYDRTERRRQEKWATKAQPVAWDPSAQPYS
jgi:hypothetical protein